MKNSSLTALSVLMLALLWSACYSQGLKTLDSNPFYWEYHGRPTLLLGATGDDNLFHWENVAGHLDTLAACGGNYARCVMAITDDKGNTPFEVVTGQSLDLSDILPIDWDRFAADLNKIMKDDPRPGAETVRNSFASTMGVDQARKFSDKHWQRLTGIVQTLHWREGDFDGAELENYFRMAGRMYDLNKLNAVYWGMFERFLRSARDRGVIVQVEVWATFSYYMHYWTALNPFNPDNNINYTEEESGLSSVNYSHPTKADNLFFRTLPGFMNNLVVLRYQQEYVDKLVEIAQKFDNVLFSMDNETSADPRWGEYWAGYIREKYQSQGREVYTTEMWDPHDLHHDWHKNTFDHPETYNFVEVSQNTWQQGQRQYDNLQWVRDRLISQKMVRPINNVKIYSRKRGEIDHRIGVDRFYLHVWGGTASARFHRPPSGNGLNWNAQRAIRGLRDVFKEFDIFSSVPDGDLLTDRDENEAYCLAAKDSLSFAVYFPDGGRVVLDGGVLGRSRMASIHWYDLDYNVWKMPYSLGTSGDLPLGTPHGGHWVAVVKVIN